MAQHLEVRHLRLVAAVVDAGTMTAAAGRLHLTQSALSHQLKEVEGRLGAALFAREGRRLKLTSAGERVLQASRRVLHELDAAEAEVATLGRARRVPLRLATECYTAYHWLPRVLGRYGALHPEVDVRIAVEATRRPVPALLAGELDVGIVAEPTPARLVRRPLFDDELVAVMAPSHRLAGRAWLAPRDFADERLLTYAIPAEQSTLMTAFLGPAGVRPREVMPVELTEALLAMVRAGMGLAVLARWAVAPELTRGTLRVARLGRSGHTRTWCAAYPRALARAPHVEAFVELLVRAGPPAGA